MKSAENTRPIIFVQGTTASGKSDLALSLALEFKGHVVNCDSIQVYKHLVVGSALPSADDFKKAPHHLFAYVDAPTEMTAGTFTEDFYSCLDDISMDEPIFVVGGTGFYFQAIEKGMYPVSKVSLEVKHQIIEELAEPDGPKKLYLELQGCDPEAAAKIHPNDSYRLGRALEIFRTEGKPLSALLEMQNNKGPQLKNVLKIGTQWDKAEITNRIAIRSQKMIDSGIIAETKFCLDQGWNHWAPLRSVGYLECMAYLENKISIENLPEEIIVHTRQLAKKQRTWFQRDKNINWLHPLNEKHKISELVQNYLKGF